MQFKTTTKDEWGFGIIFMAELGTIFVWKWAIVFWDKTGESE